MITRRAFGKLIIGAVIAKSLAIHAEEPSQIKLNEKARDSIVSSNGLNIGDKFTIAGYFDPYNANQLKVFTVSDVNTGGVVYL